MKTQEHEKGYKKGRPLESKEERVMYLLGRIEEHKEEIEEMEEELKRLEPELERWD